MRWGAFVLKFSLLLAATCWGGGCKSHAPSSPSHVVTGLMGYSDLHNSVLYRLFSSGNLSGLEEKDKAVSLSSITSSNAQMMVLSLGVPRFNMRGEDTVQIGDVVRFFRDFQTQLASYPQLEWVGDKDGMARALEKGKTAITLGLEGSWLMDGETRWVDSLYNAGVRVMGIAHRFHNPFFTPPAAMEASVGKAPSFLHPESALSDSGKALIARMIAIGMRIDLSHMPERAFWEVAEINQGQRPLMASHCNARALCPTTRNLSDAQIQAIAATGGLIGVCFHQKMLCGSNPTPGIPDLADHIEHLIQVAGEDHVALGSDLEGLITPAVGLEELAYVNAIRAELHKRGLSPEATEKVMWKNALRIF